MLMTQQHLLAANWNPLIYYSTQSNAN